MSVKWDSTPPFYGMRPDQTIQQERAARVAKQAVVYTAILRAALSKVSNA